MRNAFFFDIDGTLAIRRDVPESASASIAQLRSQGHYVFICTGRNASYVRRHFSRYADGFICANGRYAFMNDSVLYDHPIETGLLVRARDTVLPIGGGIIFFGNTHAYYDGDEELKLKLISADWDLEYKGDMFYGVVKVKTTEPLTLDETEKIKCFITSQNADGIGESIESQGIDTEDGMLFVGFWNSSNDYFIRTEKEMDIFLAAENTQLMGGI